MNLNPDLIDQIYDVPLGNSQWVDVLTKLRDEFQALLALMYVLPANQPPTIFATEPAEDMIWGSYNQYYNQLDPWKLALDKTPANVMVPGERLLHYSEFKKTAFYNDFFQRIPEHRGGIQLFSR